jgi:lipid II:glycine glycyltransferase (peptidoglycan interpeptide bridge formation enzyme)
MMDCFGDKMRLYLCYYNDTAISGALCCQYAKKTYYVFGASDNQYRNVMPNYLMQWEMIKWALEGGCKVYDFLGIPVNADPESPMIGVYRFKKGFNGEILGYVGEFDYVLNPFINTLFNVATKLKKRFYAVYRAIRGKK